jgi:O-antigen/teichoic acid export membrane protein
MRDRLTATALGAIRWNYAGYLARSLAAFAVGVVLARLLGPKPFGQFGIAAIVFGLANLFADAGFGSALVQAPELNERQIRFAFTIQLLIGFGMTLLVFAAAPLIATVFRDAGVVNVLRAISPLFLFQCFGQTSTGLIKRRMDFKSVQVAQVSSYLVGYAGVGISAAYLGFGIWSLVAAQLVQPLLYSVQVYRHEAHSLRPCFDRTGFRLLRYGSQITGANLINWTFSNIDAALVARVFGSMSLGLYTRTFNLAMNPVSSFVSTCQQVLFASCSRAGRQTERTRRAYLAAAGGVALISMPVFWSLAVCGRSVVLGLYGPQWSEAAPLFAAFAAAMPLFALMAIAGPILGAADRVGQEIRTQGISLIFAAAVFLVAVRFSLAAVAWALLITYAFRLWCASLPTLRLLGLRWSEFLAVTRGPACAALLTAAGVFFCSRTWLANSSPIVVLPVLAAAGGLLLGAITWIGGRHVIPKALVDVLLAAANDLPSYVSRPLRAFAARATSPADRRTPESDGLAKETNPI